MPRPKVSLLSVDVIADAAIELVDSAEPFGVNALARRLKVTPSSLYNHVDGRDAIIELMRGRLGERYLPAFVAEEWDAVVASTMRALHRLYADHPLIVPLIVGKTMTDPGAIATYDTLATALVEAGFPDDEVLAIIAILDAFALGFALDATSPDEVWRPEGPTRTLGRLLAGTPRGRERSDRAFEIGLELLLDSLRARLVDGPERA